MLSPVHFPNFSEPSRLRSKASPTEPSLRLNAQVGPGDHGAFLDNKNPSSRPVPAFFVGFQNLFVGRSGERDFSLSLCRTCPSDGPDLQLGGGSDRFLNSLRIIDARHLHEDLVISLTP